MSLEFNSFIHSFIHSENLLDIILPDMVLGARIEQLTRQLYSLPLWSLKSSGEEKP